MRAISHSKSIALLVVALSAGCSGDGAGPGTRAADPIAEAAAVLCAPQGGVFAEMRARAASCAPAHRDGLDDAPRASTYGGPPTSGDTIAMGQEYDMNNAPPTTKSRIGALQNPST